MASSPFCMAILFLRHGDTSPGHPGDGLSPDGRHAVQSAAQSLPPVKAILTSPETRTTDTAKIWGQQAGHTPVVVQKLVNWNLGPGHRGQHSAATDALVNHLVAHPHDVPKGGESAHQYWGRLHTTLAPLMASRHLFGVVNHSRGIKSETLMHETGHVPTLKHWKGHPLVKPAGAVLLSQKP